LRADDKKFNVRKIFKW